MASLNRICKEKLRESKPNVRVYVKFFNGANTSQLHFYIVPVLLNGKPNKVIIRVGTNFLTKSDDNDVHIDVSSRNY